MILERVLKDITDIYLVFDALRPMRLNKTCVFSETMIS